MRAALIGIGLAIVAGGAVAGPYEGIYRPDYPGAESWDCRTIGMDGGALAVIGDSFHGVENTCTLTNPVEVRGMAATLFDAECSGEGEIYGYRLMIMKTPEGIAMIEDGYVRNLVACP
jgi:hypothetical protein